MLKASIDKSNKNELLEQLKELEDLIKTNGSLMVEDIDEFCNNFLDNIENYSDLKSNESKSQKGALVFVNSKKKNSSILKHLHIFRRYRQQRGKGSQ